MRVAPAPRRGAPSRDSNQERPPVIHHFTVDVEEYFNFLGFERRVPLPQWDGLESRVEASVTELLDMLQAADATGTFFTLGWVAERHPEMVREIARRGHEIASHGYSHRRVVELLEFRFERVRFLDQLAVLAQQPLIAAAENRCKQIGQTRCSPWRGVQAGDGRRQSPLLYGYRHPIGPGWPEFKAVE